MSSVAPTSMAQEHQAPNDVPSLWTILLQRFDPRACMASFEGDLPLDVAVPLIRSNLLLEAERKKALQQLYDLTAPKRWEYRLELVSKYEILDTLAQLQSKPETRRMALLTLNNLCIPMENKRRFMEHSELLQALYTNIEEMSPDTYLACLCLRNLSCLEDASYERFLSFRKADSGKDLLAILETLTMTFAPHLLARTATRIFLQSAEGHALKWSCGILQQLSKTHAPDVARHEKCILVLLELLQHLSLHLPLHHWTMNDSLGDSCLSVIFNLALADTPLLRRLSTERYLTHLVAKGGIHATRASWIQCWLLEVGADSKPTTAGRRSVLNRMRQEDV